MATVEEPRTFIRPDGKEKVTGTGRYTADLVLAGQLVAKFRYADHAHARITRIDTTKARALPGVLAVVTHEDVPDVLYGGMVKDRRLFAKDTVRFEGDVVAGVAATTAEIAEQAAALIEVDYEPLPVVTDFEAALADGATLVHPDWESYDGRREHSAGTATRSATRTIVKGDADAAMAERRRRRQGPLRDRRVPRRADRAPRGRRAVAGRQGHRLVVDPGAVRGARRRRADARRSPSRTCASSCRCSAAASARSATSTSRAHVAALARAARRPVKLVFSREEEFVAIGHRREGMVIEFETGARARRHARRAQAQLVLDKGAYCGEGGFLGQMAAMHACGPYELENVHVESSLVYSNNQPSSSIRAPTAPQVCWALEQHMDELAAAIESTPSSSVAGR